MFKSNTHIKLPERTGELTLKTGKLSKPTEVTRLVVKINKPLESKALAWIVPTCPT
jgi:hypothetical protein